MLGRWGRDGEQEYAGCEAARFLWCAAIDRNARRSGVEELRQLRTCQDASMTNRFELNHFETEPSRADASERKPTQAKL